MIPRYHPIMPSLWDDSTDPVVVPSPTWRADYDIVLVGAGFTGLWTALALTDLDPDVRIGILEKHLVGFGASGRNGGWCSSILPMALDQIERRHGRSAAVELQKMMIRTVDDVGAVTARLGIDCDFEKGGTITLIRDSFQRARADTDLAMSRHLGLGDEHMRRLSSEETARMVRVAGRPEANFQPACAALQPRKLVAGLTRTLIDRGVDIHEGVAARGFRDHAVLTDRGPVRAGSTLLCTEAYSARLPGYRRSILPLYSLMIATEPLSEEIWDEIGLSGRTTFADHRHLIVYGQRTADGRLAFGGRGAPYHFGSRITPAFDTDERVRQHLIDELVGFFPVLADVRCTHHWGGPLGVPRDWSFSVDYEPRSGLGRAGGYVGDGVATSFLAGHTLADLVLGRSTDRTRQPFVGHRSPHWEPEPARWIAVNGLARVAARMDATEKAGRRPARIVRRVMSRLTGG